MTPQLIGLFIAAAGIFSITAVLGNWDWFMNHRKARFFIAILGRTGTRIFYGILGTLLLVLGTLVSLGIISPEKM